MRNKGISSIAMFIVIIIIMVMLFLIIPKYVKTTKVRTPAKKTATQKRYVPYVGTYKKGTSKAKDILAKSKERLKY